MVLMLTCSMSGNAIDLTKVGVKLDETSAVSASSSLSSATFKNIQQRTSLFTNTKFAWTTDMELGSKPVSENNISNQQRLRRVLEDNLFFEKYSLDVVQPRESSRTRFVQTILL